MTWEVICHILNPYGIIQSKQTNFEQADKILLMQEDGADQSNIIYVSAGGSNSRVFQKALVISVGEDSAFADNYIRVQSTDIAQVFNALAGAQSWLNGLSTTLALCYSDQEIIDRASLHLQVPMFYLDESYRILAITKSLSFEGDEEWVHMSQKGYLSPANAKRMKETGDLDLLAPAHAPMIYASKIYPYTSIISNVWVDGRFVSRINVLCVNGDTSPLMVRACELLTAQLERTWRRKGEAALNGPLQSMLIDLLHGIRLSEDLIKERIESLPHLKGKLFQIFYADVKAKDDKQLASYYASLLTRLYPEEQFLPLIWQDQLILLAYAQEEVEFDTWTAKLSHFFTSNNFKCGVSNHFRAIGDIRGFYEQAAAALKRGDGYGLYFYRDIMLEQMLSLIPGDKTPYLITPDIYRLVEAEQMYSFSMVETLKAYLECNCNLIRTAEHLCLHKNTLLYRLNHIRGVIRCDLNDAKERLLLMLSFQLLEQEAEG